jgi:hypothetical protein
MIPDDDLLAEIQRLANGDTPPTSGEFAGKADYGLTTIKRRWGSWNAAVREAGFTPQKRHSIPEKELLNEINKLASAESPPTYEEFDDQAEYGISTVQRVCGSWNNAVRKAGFTVNQEWKIPEKRLLIALREDAQGEIAPKQGETTTHIGKTYHEQFESYWQACVRAGLQPYDRRPLTQAEFEGFFEATAGQQKPLYQLIGLLSLFTGLPARFFSKLSRDWITTSAESVVVTVPPTETRSDEKWTFKLPSGWTDANTERRSTDLPGLLNWVVERNGSLNNSSDHVEEILYQIAQDAGLQNREQIHRTRIGNAPQVRPADLRATGGIQMARNGAPTRRIRRHLGIKHTNWEADVEDFFLWLYIHEGYTHPDYDPPDVVLDPVTE